MNRRGPEFGPAVVLDVTEIVEQAPFIRNLLRDLGVHGVDLDDVAQDVIVGAWQSMQVGRFCPVRGKPVHVVLRNWLVGIAFNQASHYRGRAYRRREILVKDPLALAPEETADPQVMLDATEALAAVWTLPPWAREVLTLAARGLSPTETAEVLAMPVGTVFGRL